MIKAIRKPASLSPKRRAEEKQIGFMASMIEDQAMLDKFLEGSTGEMREALLARVTPHLTFTPALEIAPDCPNCGLRKGSAINHECLLVN